MINLKKVPLRKRHKFLALFLLAILVIYFLGNFLYSQIFKVVPDTTYYFMPSIGFTDSDKKILIFSPHPDDETLSSAGYIQAALARGIEVKVVLVTDGNRRGQGEKRQTQFKQAMKDLGLKDDQLTFLEYKDGFLKNVNQNDLDAVFAKIMKDFDPQIVIYPTRFDEHPDHRVTGLAIERILKDNQKIDKFAYLVHFNGYPFPHKLKMDRFLMEPSKLFFSCQWFRFGLTSDQEHKKLEALNNYKVSLSYPREKGYLYSFVRQNELFCQE